MAHALTIGQLAHGTGVPAKTIRYDECEEAKQVLERFSLGFATWCARRWMPAFAGMTVEGSVETSFRRKRASRMSYMQLQSALEELGGTPDFLANATLKAGALRQGDYTFDGTR